MTDANVKRLDHVLQSWLGTPYSAGKSQKKRAVGCYPFVFRVLEELYRLPAEPIPFIPSDLPHHAPQEALRLLVTCINRFAYEQIPVDTTPEPGDVLVFRSGPKVGPSHIAIMGARPNQLWHATKEGGVHWTGWSAALGELISIYRPSNKESWIS